MIGPIYHLDGLSNETIRFLRVIHNLKYYKFIDINHMKAKNYLTKYKFIDENFKLILFFANFNNFFKKEIDEDHNSFEITNGEMKKFS